MFDFLNLKTIDLDKGKPKLKDAPLKSDSFLKWMWFLLKGHKGMFFLTSGNSFLRQLINNSQPFFFGQITTALTVPYTLYDMNAAWFWLTLLAIAFIINYLLFFFYQYNARLMTVVQRQLSMLTLKHYFSLPLAWHEQTATGENLQKILQARSGVRDTLISFYYTILPMIGGIFAAFVTLYITDISAMYYLIFTLFVLSFVAVTLYVGDWLKHAFKKLNISEEKVMGRVMEFANHVRLVKAVSLAPSLLKKAKPLEEKGVLARGEVSMSTCWFWFINNVTGLFWMIIISTLGIQAVLSGEIVVGAFVTLVFTANLVWDRMESFSTALSQIIEHKASVMRGVSLLRETAEKVDIRPFKKLPTKWQKIRFDNVSFSYSEKEKSVQHVLNDVSLTINRGEHVGIVGFSGSGKSTLIKLLMKQALPSSGTVYVDNVPLKNIKRDNYVSEVALVPQEIELFNDSIKENITITEKIADKTLKTVLKKAYVDEFIDQLPEGLDTIIGERGVKLSGGQKQRLGIARAIARNSEIVIFDEATSALDSVSERYIQESIKSSFKKKTMVVIAHRLATIAHLDRVIVMDKGKIVEQGTHEELIRNNGIYARMWHLQSDGFLADKKQ